MQFTITYLHKHQFITTIQELIYNTLEHKPARFEKIPIIVNNKNLSNCSEYEVNMK